jgi:hypothetical protein
VLQTRNIFIAVLLQKTLNSSEDKKQINCNNRILKCTAMEMA